MAQEIIGRIPPHSTEAEKSLIGSVLYRNKALEEVAHILVSSDFYEPANKAIWECLISFRNDNPSLAIDLVSFTQYVKEIGRIDDCGGIPYIASLTNTASYVNAGYYAQIIREKSMKRQLLELSLKIGDKAFDETEPAKASIDAIETKLSALIKESTSDTYRSSSDFIDNLVKDIQEKMHGLKSPGLSSGFRSLDNYIGGFKESDMIIIGARPSVGKTAFALSIAHNMAFRKNGTKVGFFSLEMNAQSLMERIMAREASVNAGALRNGKLDNQSEYQMLEAADRLKSLGVNMFIQDTPNIKLSEIKAQARRMVRENKVQILFIDYIGLIELDDAQNMDRHLQVATISRSLKSLARELCIPIVILCQVNRDAAKERPPMLSDLRESGAIEQDADIVMLLDDPSKRVKEDGKIEDYEEDATPDYSNVKVKKLKVIIAKQRNGSTGAFNMNFISSYVSFTDIDKSEEF